MHDESRRLRFYLDFVSHNAWLAWHAAAPLAARHGLWLDPVPVVFGGMLRAFGQVGPAEIAPKRAWMTRNVLRKARVAGIPLAPPASHPFNSLLSLRVACCAPDAATRAALCTRLFRAAWVESRPLQDPETVAAVLREAGLDAQAWLAQAQSDAIKAQLRAQTDEAVRGGVFGVPTLRLSIDGVARDFWGYDDLEHLERALQGREPVGDDELQAWLAVPASVERRR